MTRPKPIIDPRADHYSVVIAFTVPPYDGASVEEIHHRLWRLLDRDPLGYRTPQPEGLDIAVRVIGAGGERSEDEGRWDR